MSRIRVAIVDDQRLFAGSLRVVLEGHGAQSIEVAGIAYDGREALDLVQRELPDVVLMDVRMPVMDGVQATREIMRRFPQTKIIILTTFDDDEYVWQALQHGAMGYLLKNIEPQQLVTSIEAVADGQFLVSPAIRKKIIGRATTASRHETPFTHNAAEVNFLLGSFPQLSRREAEVLYLLSQNYDNREIAEMLYIAEQTVKNYTSRIYAKLEVPDRVHAIRKINALYQR